MLQAPYERLITSTPQLIWATARSWSASEAAAISGHYEGRENTSWFVQEGSARVTSDDGIITEVHAGQWLFIRPGMRHQEFHGPFRFLSIGLRWRWPGDIHLFHRKLPYQAADEMIPDLRPMAEDVIHRTSQLFPQHHHYLMLGTTTLAAFGQLTALTGTWATAFAAAMEQCGIEPELLRNFDHRLEAMHQLIASLPLDQAFPASLIESVTGLSERQLNRLSKAHGGHTAREALDTRRYESAREMLMEPGRRIKEVASALGFADLSLFNRWFQRRAGLSPRDFQNRTTKESL